MDMSGLYILAGVYLLMAAFLGAVLVAEYVLQGLGLSALRKGRERHPMGRGRADSWMAWIPFASSWLLGDMADEVNWYRGKRTYWRICLLILSILQGCVGIVSLIYMVTGITSYNLYDYTAYPGIGMAAAYLLINGLALGVRICQALALNRLFQDYDPRNNVLYAVLSFLFHPCAPIFLFVIRKKPSISLWQASQYASPTAAP